MNFLYFNFVFFLFMRIEAFGFVRNNMNDKFRGCFFFIFFVLFFTSIWALSPRGDINTRR